MNLRCLIVSSLIVPPRQRVAYLMATSFRDDPDYSFYVLGSSLIFMGRHRDNISPTHQARAKHTAFDKLRGARHQGLADYRIHSYKIDS